MIDYKLEKMYKSLVGVIDKKSRSHINKGFLDFYFSNKVNTRLNKIHLS